MAQSQNIVVSERTGLFRNVRNNFTASYLDNWTEPPAQDPDSWTQFRNLMPVTKGILERRWGSKVWAAINPASDVTPTRIWDVRQLDNYTPNDAGTGKYRLLLTAWDGTGLDGTNNGIEAFDPNGTVAVPRAGGLNPFNAWYLPRSTALNPARVLNSRGWAYICDGDAWPNGARKWQVGFKPNNVVNANNWGIAAPTVTPSFSVSGASGLTLQIGREYTYCYVNQNTGHCSDLGPFIGQGVVTNQQINIWGFGTPPNDIGQASYQVTHGIILATSDGGDREHLRIVTNATYPTGLIPIATFIGFNAGAPFVDTLNDSNTDGTGLLHNNIYLELDSNLNEIGVAGNQPPPPKMQFLAKWSGRIWGAAGPILYFSKTISETLTSTNSPNTGRWEECWPPEFQLDIGNDGAENCTGLLTDGQFLYYGTQKRIGRIVGTDPSSYQPGQSLHEGIGVHNQQVWEIVQADEKPVGCMWMTPDFRVFFSDFNTYTEVGRPVQTTLQSINVASAQNAWAVSVSKGAYNFYVLAIPTGANSQCDTLLVYNTSTGRWVGTWDLAVNETSPASIFYPVTDVTFVPQWITASGTAQGLRQFVMDETTARQDLAATPFTAAWKTPWLDFGYPEANKVLNEIEVATDETSLANYLVTVEAATTRAQFATPVSLVSNAQFVASPLAIDGTLKKYLAGLSSGYRFFRFTFTSPNAVTTKNLMAWLGVEATVFNKF